MNSNNFVPFVNLKFLRLVHSVTLLLVGMTCASAWADGGHSSRHVFVAGPGWHGDIGRFHEHDWHVWRGGNWYHGYHGHQMGWWWIVGGVWYFYPAPVYPYPNPYEPPPTYIVTPSAGNPPPPPPTQYWYYCDSPSGYYPYVPTCSSGWKQVPATPAPPAPPATPAN